MRCLIAAVYVKDPTTREDLILLPGQSPPPQIAELVTNPEAWDVLTDAEGREGTAAGSAPATLTPDPDQAADVEAGEKPAAKKTTQRRSRPGAQ